MTLAADVDHYLAGRGWVGMREIKADLELGWDDARRVWGELLPGLVSMGFVEREAPTDSRAGARFQASEAFRAWVAAERTPAEVGG